MNRDRILQYLSDLLSESEKEKFLDELKSDQTLKNEYQKIVLNLDKVKQLNDVEADERYFTSLIPKIKERKQPKTFKIPAYALTSIAVVLIGFFVTFDILENGNGKTSLIAGYENVIIDLASDPNYNLSEEFSDFDIFASNEVLLDKLDLNENDVDILPEFQSNNSTEYFDYNQLEYQIINMNQSEVNSIIKEMDENKIL